MLGDIQQPVRHLRDDDPGGGSKASRVRYGPQDESIDGPSIDFRNSRTQCRTAGWMALSFIA
jgi:hypothetical protein